jgi:hypothetical protein
MEIPDVLLQRAKTTTAERGIPLRQLVIEAIAEKLSEPSPAKPWLRAFGKLRGLHRETARIDRVIRAEFGQIEPEDRRRSSTPMAFRSTSETDPR